MAKVLFFYEAANEDELTLKVGDIITDLAREEDEGWLAGSLNGKRGVFPDNFVALAQEAAAAPPNIHAPVAQRCK